MFANQFKRITRVKLRAFILKVANSGPQIAFFVNVMQLPGTALTGGTVPGAPRSY